MIELSIIIPTFNTPECRLRRCLESIYSQLSDSMEVIIIDDGSTGSFAKNLKILKGQYKFLLLEQSNRGVAAARNNGILKSSGKYIMFVDADDSIHIGCIKRGIELMEKYDADIALGGINIVEGENIKKCAINQNHELVLDRSGIDTLQKYMIAIRCERDNDELKNLRCTGPWAKIIKRTLILNKKFDEKLQIYEDLLFNLSVLDDSHTAIIDTHIWYNYYIHQDSAIHKYRKNGVEQLKFALEEFQNLVNCHQGWNASISIKVIECLNRVFNNTVFHDENNVGKKLTITKCILKDPLVEYLLYGFDEEVYSFANWKEHFLWWAFSNKKALLVVIFYKLKNYMHKIRH